MAVDAARGWDHHPYLVGGYLHDHAGDPGHLSDHRRGGDWAGGSPRDRDSQAPGERQMIFTRPTIAWIALVVFFCIVSLAAGWTVHP